MNIVLRTLAPGAVLAASLLAGCASEPIQFYTLIPPQAAEAPPPAAAPFLIEVLPVDAPTQVGGPQLVLRRGEGSILLMETHRWIAPVEDEARTAIVDRLSRRLGTTDVYDLPRARDARVYRIKIELTRFELRLDQYALIEAVWSLRPLDSAPEPLICTSRVRRAVAPGFEALVEGQQHALLAVADAIATALSEDAARCPGA